MKFIVTADVHIHNKPYPNSKELGKQVLDDLTRLCRQHRASGIIVVGDLWDQKHATPVEVLLTIQEWLETTCKVYWVRGNHECQSRTNPEESLIKLFEDVGGCSHAIFNSPSSHCLGGNIYFHFVPWYPTERMKKELNKIHESVLLAKSRGSKARNILFAHCGLREGKVSAEGFRVPTDLSIKDLHPDLYEYVLLGDYHGHQFLADNVLYLGEPVPRTFGSFDTVGAWLLDLSEDRTKLEALSLPSKYPRFLIHHVGTGTDLAKPLDPFDRHRITTIPEILPRVVDRYPFAEVIPIEEKIQVLRDPKINLRTHEEVLRDYCEKHYSKEGKKFYATARGYLAEGSK